MLVPSQGKPSPLPYTNAPFHQLGRVLRKGIEERLDCLFIVPVWPRSWRGLLHDLLIRARWLLKHDPNLCIPGPMVPNAANRRPMVPKYRIEALYVVWRGACPDTSVLDPHHWAFPDLQPQG